MQKELKTLKADYDEYFKLYEDINVQYKNILDTTMDAMDKGENIEKEKTINVLFEIINFFREELQKKHTKQL